MTTEFENAVTGEFDLKVHTTLNYDIFNNAFHRHLSEANIEQLKQSFTDRYIINPIIVNERYEIIDGQHRFAASKELGIPIFYIIVPGLTINDSMRLNAKQRNWTERDFVECYAFQGNENYRRLLDVANEMNIPVRIPLHFIPLKEQSGANTIKSGNLIFTEDNAKQVTELYPKIEKLAKTLNTPCNTIFVLACIRAFRNKKTFERLQANAKYFSEKYQKVNSVREVEEQFAKICAYK